MKLKEVITLNGKPGLYKVLAKSAKGYVVESIDQKRTRSSIDAHHQVFMLDEINVFGTTRENIPLREVLANMKQHEAGVPSANADPTTLRAFFAEVAPDNDESQVYISHIKKIIKWYELLAETDVFEEDILLPPSEDGDQEDGAEEAASSASDSKEEKEQESTTEDSESEEAKA